MRVSRSLFAVLAAMSSLVVGPLNASELIRFHTENLQLLHGFDYEVGDRERTIITFEHANAFTYGDMFLFTDFTLGDDRQRGVYGEFSPRLSLTRMTGQNWSFGPVNDVLIAGTYEFGDEGLERFLIGGAVDLDVPGFTFLRLQAYHRDDPTRPGSTWQGTVIWNRPFEVGGQRFLAEGVADFAGSEGAGVANQLIVPRLLWNLPLGSDQSSPLYLGIEHQYWNNKFGIDGVVENVTQIQLKWVLH